MSMGAYPGHYRMSGTKGLGPCWYMVWPYLDKNDVAAYEVKISSTDIDPMNKTGKRKVKHYNISKITYVSQ